jgi:transcriptional regulator NrdR family protein
MVCIYCSSDTQVINSRLQRRANQTWRRRKCVKCKSVFTSLEGADYASSLTFRTSQNNDASAKAKAALQPFQRDVLFVSILESCKHRKTATQDATALTDTILGRLRPHMTNAVLDRTDVIKTALPILKRFDKAAGVHYRAYHPL